MLYHFLIFFFLNEVFLKKMVKEYIQKNKNKKKSTITPWLKPQPIKKPRGNPIR